MTKTRAQLVDALHALEDILPRLRADNPDDTDYAMAFMGVTEEVVEEVGESDASWFLQRLKVLQNRYSTPMLGSNVGRRLAA